MVKEKIICVIYYRKKNLNEVVIFFHKFNMNRMKIFSKKNLWKNSVIKIFIIIKHTPKF